MRLKCEYKTDEIPFSHNMLFVSLIKEALKRSDPDYFNHLYFYYGHANKQSKNFTFAVYIKDYAMVEDKFKVNDRVVFNISSPDLEFMIKLYNGLLKIHEFEYKGFILQKLRIELVKEKQISQNEVIFKTLAPICIKNKNNYFMKIEDEGYIDEFNYIADVILKNYRGNGLRKRLTFIPVDMKKIVVKEKIKGFNDRTNKNHMHVNAYTGIFKLKGSNEDLKDLYMLGIGFKRNQGFGMVEVIG
ncbi:CRISPR-associated endoribonuclease Cas6 [Clostridiaceae bacterium 35-E11]